MPKARSSVLKYYFDINLVVSDEMSLPAMVGQAMDKIHGFIADNPGKVVVAFPEFEGRSLGGKIRLFAQSFQDLDLAKESLRSHFFFRDYSVYSLAQEVPETFDGKWQVFCRAQIPSKAKVASKGSIMQKKRKQKLEEIQQYPYFNVKSRSNGQSFTIIVSRQEIDEPVGAEDIVLNGYGLSTKGRVVAVPALD
ncbi:MAG: type I-F CRISPR-associated endoribonuclease Cas6/Csy4 [Pseudomonadales bacterium]|nr:type I-F CRISPR-associated endoribonuclease Cas6/Csy4 [Pseudomonadales bacterium]